MWINLRRVGGISSDFRPARCGHVTECVLYLQVESVLLTNQRSVEKVKWKSDKMTDFNISLLFFHLLLDTKVRITLWWQQGWTVHPCSRELEPVTTQDVILSFQGDQDRSDSFLNLPGVNIISWAPSKWWSTKWLVPLQAANPKHSQLKAVTSRGCKAPCGLFLTVKKWTCS